MLRKKYTFFSLLMFIAFCSYGQQQAMFTQYMFNGLAINPAYAGSQGAIDLTTLARRQWAGMDGAPSTQTFSVHGPIKNKNIALGMLLFHDRIGISNQYGLYGSYAYRIKIGEGMLSSGLQVGFNSYKTNFSEILTQREDDPHFSYNSASAFLPNVGAGLYYSNQRWYAGFSLPQLLTNELPGTGEGRARQYRHWFATAGYVIDLNEDLKLKPNVLVKAVQGAPLEVDLNANLLIKETVWIGASYRSMDALSFLLELQANQQMRIGYAYDLATTQLANSHNGSHELMLNYRLPFEKSKIITPRYF